MRVYELVSALSECPAGAEVNFSMLASAHEIKKTDIQEHDGETYYQITQSIKDVEDASNEDRKMVFLYA